jgi:hypothetical protein
MRAELMLESAVNFMINSLFACIGIMLIVITILVINNLFNRYWRPIKFIQYEVREKDYDEH